MLQALLQDRLSSALGASISFDKLSISPFRGMVDGRGLHASIDETATPFLTVERLQLKVQLSALLHKRIEVETVLIERPAISIHRAADGRWNLPIEALCPATAPGSPPAPAAPPDEPPRHPWHAGVRRLIVTGAGVRYTDQSPGFDGFAATAEPIHLELTRGPGADEMTLIGAIDSLRRTDRPAALGPLRLSGVVQGVDALPDVASLRGGVAVDGDALRLHAERSGSSVTAGVTVRSALAVLLDLLPNPWRPALPDWLAPAGVDVQLRLAWSPTDGLRITTAAP